MAKPASVIACMFCGNMPCTCGKEPKPKTKKPKAKVQVETVPVPILERKSMRDAMKATAVAKPAIKPITPIKPVHKKPITPVEDLLWADSIRNLVPILHETERVKYQVLISAKPSAAERAAIWKVRRDGG